MAKSPSSKRSIPNFLKGMLGTFTGGYSDKQLEPYTKNMFAPKANLYSDADREKMLQISQLSSAQGTQSQLDPLQYFGALSRKSILTTLDNERIIQMAPEISLAASVMVPSILAPNDMREGRIKFECDESSITTAQRTKIGDIVSDFGEDYFHFSTTLPKWIEEAMYRSGAMVLMVLPLSKLMDEITDPNNFVETGSVESFSKKLGVMESENVFGFGGSSSGVKASLSLESLDLDGAILQNAPKSVVDSQKSRSGTKQKAFESLVDSVTSDQNLLITDNPDSTTAKTLRNRRGKTQLQKKISIRYKEAEYLALDSMQEKDRISGHPMFMTIPAEAVIPIFTPGSPEDHIGYFIVEDEYGHPVNAVDEKNNGLFSNPTNASSGQNANQSTFLNLFQSYGFTQQGMYDQLPERQVMEGIYQQIIENHLKARAAGAGFADVGLGQNSSLYRAMFTRYLEQRKTKLIFVPKEFITYFCFKHSQYGTGVSKLEDLKWILSLRISLLVARMLSAFKNSIDRKLIEINFDGQYPGNALAHARTAQREAINKDLIVFNSDPTDMAQQIVERSYSVKLNGIPGLPAYSITRDTDNRSQSPQPDSALSDDIRNMEYLGLEVPPAVLNNLSDAEFSRSVATTNIVFSRKLAVYQMVVCKYINEFMRTFIRFSEILRREISAVLRSDGSRPEKPGSPTGTDSGTMVDDSTNSAKKLLDVIEHISMVLPSPTMAPDDAQFDTLSKMTASLGGLIDLYLNDDIVGDNDEMKTALTALKAMVKSQMVQTYAKRIGIDDTDFPDLASDLNSDHLFKVRHALLNIAEGLKKQPDALRIDPNAQTDSGFGGAGSSSPDSSSSSAPFGPSTPDDDVDNFDDNSGNTTPASTTTDTTSTSTVTDNTEPAPEDGDVDTTQTPDGGIPPAPDGSSLV